MFGARMGSPSYLGAGGAVASGLATSVALSPQHEPKITIFKRNLIFFSSSNRRAAASSAAEIGAARSICH
jgi:hypothetical protein